jgi:hypothetical protein
MGPYRFRGAQVAKRFNVHVSKKIDSMKRYLPDWYIGKDENLNIGLLYSGTKKACEKYVSTYGFINHDLIFEIKPEKTFEELVNDKLPTKN